MTIRFRRRLPVGAEVIGLGRVHVRVWAPAVTEVHAVSLGSSTRTPLESEGGGYFSGLLTANAGDRYGFELNGDLRRYPDPASRFQPDGPHGASQIVDPSAFVWTDGDWNGVAPTGQVLYELHAGTFTPEGTWAAAACQLADLAQIGVTVIELLPIAEFDGRFGWGYDGVDLFAPSHLYGAPDDLRTFVDRAHGLGIGVILDVVYNHLGPVGNYLKAFAPAYFTDRYENEWGEALNFDGDDSGPVREFFIANAGYWIDEFHLDGLRLDATQQIFDRSSDHILAEVGRRVREAARGRRTLIVAENEPQDSRLVRSVDKGGYGLDAMWNDDFHHSAMAALTGRAEAYYSDTPGRPQELVSAAKYGFLFQGQHYDWQRQGRGTPSLDLEPHRFVNYLQNHDQVANSASGLRGHQLASPAKWRAMTAVLLLLPGLPMLFQGQEFSASAPFLFFAEFDAATNAAVRDGRATFLEQFPSSVAYRKGAALDDPSDPMTFARCKLSPIERREHVEARALHADLLRLRRETRALHAGARGDVDGAVLSASAFLLRFFTPGHAGDRLLVVNLGPDLHSPSFAEPLTAPPAGTGWRLEWSSEDPRYGGSGMPALQRDGRWRVPAESAVVLAPGPVEHRRPKGAATA
jgi:maltooligosyltrehalose trehalohydrolase